MASLKRILVAVDFETPSFAALDWAIDLASQVGASGLIAVGTHGRKRLARALLGSIAERTVRSATRPVVVVHALK